MDRLSNWLKYYVCINFCLCSIYFYFACVNFHACYVWNTDIFYREHQRYFLGEKKFLQQFFGLNAPFWYTCSCLASLVPFSFTQKLYVCFNHFYKIKIRESVKNHPQNLEKTKIAIYRFQKYAQNNLFSSFSTMLKPSFNYVLSTPLYHHLI